jgi:DNA mismatch endonuclease (patch repair protein)
VKISKTRKRDARNHRRLRAMGWTVIRLWQHNVEQDFERSIGRIVSALKVDDTFDAKPLR